MTMKKEISDQFPFQSNYVTVNGSKIHFIDVGKGNPILFLHGNPTSSYLWRNIIPYLSHQGRCIAPDLIGMGKSDQPQLNYGFFDTYSYLKAFIAQLGLTNITLVIHDWGSGLGFHYANEHRDNIKGIAFMESLYRTMKWENLDLKFRVSFRLMRTPVVGWFMINVGHLFIKKMLPNATIRTLTEKEMAYYAAPYPNLKSRKPLRVWPTEIPISGSPKNVYEVVNNYHQWLKETEIPKLCLYGSPGIMIKKNDVEWLKKHFPNLSTKHIGEALHFVQEDQPHAIGEALSEWITNT